MKSNKKKLLLRNFRWLQMAPRPRPAVKNGFTYFRNVIICKKSSSQVHMGAPWSYIALKLKKNKTHKKQQKTLHFSVKLRTSGSSGRPPGHFRSVKMGLYASEMLKYVKTVGLDCVRSRPRFTRSAKELKPSYG